MILDVCPPHMHPCHSLTAEDFGNMEDVCLIKFELELFSHDWVESYATENLQTKCQWTDAQSVVANQHHLTAKKQCDLFDVFGGIKNYLMVHWEFILTKRFTLT